MTAKRFFANYFTSARFPERMEVAVSIWRQGRMLRDGNLVIDGRIFGDIPMKLRGVWMEFQDVETSEEPHSNI
jgi:hypothetical protein